MMISPKTNWANAKLSSNYCPDVRSSKRSGEVLGNVSMKVEGNLRSRFLNHPY